MAEEIIPAADPATPAAEGEQVDIAQIKSMLNLPDTATDIELITVLVNLIAALQTKYEGLLQDAVTMEDSVANRDVADFADVVDEASAPFWKEQILTNRAAALGALETIRRQMKAVAVPAPAPAPAAPAALPSEPCTISLRNRLAALPRTVSTVATDAAPGPTAEVAVRIRNRASEIMTDGKTTYAIAFAKAEKEITAPKE